MQNIKISIKFYYKFICDFQFFAVAVLLTLAYSTKADPNPDPQVLLHASLGLSPLVRTFLHTPTFYHSPIAYHTPLIVKTDPLAWKSLAVDLKPIELKTGGIELKSIPIELKTIDARLAPIELKTLDVGA